MNTLDNPNLDGDFKALLKVQEGRKQQREAWKKKHAAAREAIAEGIEEEEGPSPGGEPSAKQADDVETLEAKHQLHDAVSADDLSLLRKALERVAALCLSLKDEAFRDSETNATIMHRACDEKAYNVAKALIESQNYHFLIEHFNITITNIPSKKTTLHQLVEWGQEDLVMRLLEMIPGGDTKQQFMRESVLTEVPGQRPRHLSAIHLAALHGHTSLVMKLVNLGLDVNTTNNKNDTPLLWACRNNNIKTARQLMKMGADVQLQNDKGSSPLYFAVRYGFEDLVTVLIQEGKADVHQQRKLGLISPIVLASALGYTKIVKTLLDHGADVNLKITGGYTPLHHASMQGNLDTAELLIQRGADLHEDNETGDCALLLAAQQNQVEVVEMLVKHGARLGERNKQGMSIWDFAVEAEDHELLIAAVNCYRRVHNIPHGKLTMSMAKGNKTPVHSAALKGNCEKIRVLRSLGVDLGMEDEGGNTFFHLAAREDQTDVLEEFMGSVSVDAQNSDKETALHLAARNGNLDAIKILLRKVRVGVENSSKETALHVACRSYRASPEVIGLIVETIVKAHNWSLVDAVDKNGDTALHVAARWGRSELVEQLRPLNPRLCNSAGEAPLHVAAKEGQVDVVQIMIEIFGKDLNVNQQNRNGDSVLHIAAERGDATLVELLISQGADLSCKNSDGNTPLHLLAIQSDLDPDNSLKYLQVFTVIESNAVRWWCMRRDLMHPDSQSEVHEKYRRAALWRLTSRIPNNERLTVSMIAAMRGAKDLLERILHVPKVYVLQTDTSFVFDVSDLTHETMLEAAGAKKEKKASRVSPSQASQVTMSDADELDKTSYSCLDLIVRSRNLQVANQMLDIVPIRQIVGNYWNAYQWIYGTIMVVHLVYMSLLSAYAIPLITDDDPQAWPYLLFLSWPTAILLLEIYIIVVGAYNMRKKRDIQSKYSVQSDSNVVSRYLKRFLDFCINNLSHFTAVVFSSLVIAWFILYLTSTSSNQAKVLAFAVILGWLYTIAFTEGFETVHAFTIMLKNIIIRDMTRFLFLYLLVMFAFALAFKCLFALAEDLTDEYPDAFSIFFVTFNMMIGMGDFFIDNFDDQPNSTFIKALYLFYIILTTVILLNLVIAMMTDSYAAVKASEGTTWRVGSVRLAVELEKSMPFLPRIFNVLGIKHNPMRYDPDTKRWMMTIPKRAVIYRKEITRDNAIEAIARLQRELREMKLQYADISDRLQVLMEKSYERPSSAGAARPGPRVRRSVVQPRGSMTERRPSLGRHGESDLFKFQKSARSDLSLKL